MSDGGAALGAAVVVAVTVSGAIIPLAKWGILSEPGITHTTAYVPGASVIVISVGPPPGTPAFGPPAAVTQAGSGPGFLKASARSAVVLPSASRMSCTWWRLGPWFTRRMVTRPAGATAGASKPKSFATIVIVCGVVARQPTSRPSAMMSLSRVRIVPPPTDWKRFGNRAPYGTRAARSVQFPSRDDLLGRVLPL